MLATTSSDWVNYLLAVFLLITGLTLGFALYKLADVFARLASFIRGAEREMMPVIHSAGGTVDRVNAQLDQIEPATASAVDAVEAVDEAVRAVSFAVKRPIEKLVGLSAGASHGWATLKTRRSVGQAMRSAKEAAARREVDFEEELHHPEQFGPRPTPVRATPPLATPPGTVPPSGVTPSGASSTSGTSPSRTPPTGTSPSATSPGGTSSGGTSPGSTSPGGSPPGGSSSGGTSPGGSPPGGSSSGGTSPSNPPPDQH
jgi:uncharacterized membrane protein YgcG